MNNFRDLIDREIKRSKVYKSCNHEYKFDRLIDMYINGRRHPPVKWSRYTCKNCGMNKLDPGE